MPNKILAGPILGLESDINYTICFFTAKKISTPTLVIDPAQSISVTKITETPHGLFWRASFNFPVSANSTFVGYQILVDGEAAVDRHGRAKWQFYVPAKSEQPRIAYASCNGFSSADLHQKTSDPYALWKKMSVLHNQNPFSLLIMGGDQLYADSIWVEVPSLRHWKEQTRRKKIKKRATKKLTAELDRFYENLYMTQWQNEFMSLLLASIPSLMMWDDHDIFDGWGSYPDDQHNCPTYQAIFKTAKRYFELFQIRSIKNSTLLSKQQDYYSFLVKFRNFHVLGLDNRSQRTLNQVMEDRNNSMSTHWQKVITQLRKIQTDNLLVLSGMPVVYRDFSHAESLLDLTPWQEELTDDIKDHWRANRHQGERLRLIMHLLSCHSRRKQTGKTTRTIILSGDVHIGCMGAIIDKRMSQEHHKIHQIVSSGIVHPPPTQFEWLGITATSSDKKEMLNVEQTIEARIIEPVAGDKYMRTRNFAYLVEGDDNKLWANWICELGCDAEYPLE